jgi:DNA polymerase III delta subunit
MISIPSFDQLLDAISQLPPEEQADLVDVVRRRLSELRRREIVAEVLEAERELQRGSSEPRAARDVIRDIAS